MVLLGDGDAQPKAMEAGRKTPVGVNEMSPRQNANGTSHTKEEDEHMSHFWDTEMYVIPKVPGHHEEKRTRKERGGRDKRRM